jgi:hypothetical protein
MRAKQLDAQIRIKPVNFMISNEFADLRCSKQEAEKNGNPNPTRKRGTCNTIPRSCVGLGYYQKTIFQIDMKTGINSRGTAPFLVCLATPKAGQLYCLFSQGF